jgi:1-acyl-sn-glycerol-3-phosphate acyltransferase
MTYKRGDPLIDRRPLFLAASKVLSWLVAILGWPIVRLLYRYRVKGRENLAPLRGRPAVFVANHSVPLDCLIQGLALLPRFSYFTVIEETIMTPILGSLVRLLGGMPIPTDPARLGDIDAAMEAALKGHGGVYFYAEGECFLYNQEIKPFKAGAFYYAIMQGAPIVPVVSVLKRPGSGGGPLGCGALGRADKRLGITVHILPPLVPPPAAGRRSADLHSALILARQTREAMQAIIDRERGDKGLYRGPMPRIKGVNDGKR